MGCRSYRRFATVSELTLASGRPDLSQSGRQLCLIVEVVGGQLMS